MADATGFGSGTAWRVVVAGVLVCAGLAFCTTWRAKPHVAPAATARIAQPMTPAPAIPAVAGGLAGLQDAPATVIPPQELASLEQTFRNDGVDGAWSVPAEQRLTEAATEPALTRLGMPYDFRADCAAHLCRIAMHFPSRQSADDWAQFYPVGVGGTLSAVRVQEHFEPDGSVRLLVFGAREGFSPMLARANSGRRPTAPSGP